jgi:hypothetical protein
MCSLSIKKMCFLSTQKRAAGMSHAARHEVIKKAGIECVLSLTDPVFSIECGL